MAITLLIFFIGHSVIALIIIVIIPTKSRTCAVIDLFTNDNAKLLFDNIRLYLILISKYIIKLDLILS